MGYNIENSTVFSVFMRVLVFLLLSVIGTVVIMGLLKLVGLIG